MEARQLTEREIELKGHPRPGFQAQIVDPKRITSQVRVGQAEVLKYLQTFMAASAPVPSYGTIGRLLAGNIGSYTNVNWIFTAINIRYRSFERRELVYVSERKGQEPTVDDSFDLSLVFPRLAVIMKDLSITDDDLSQITHVARSDEVDLIGVSNIKENEIKKVRTIYIESMRRGLPVRRDKVGAAVRALNEKFGLKLSLGAETCG